MSQFLLYILGTIGTAVLTTIVGQVTTRFVPVGGAPKPSDQAAKGSATVPAISHVAGSPVPGTPYVVIAPVRGPAVSIGAVIMQAGILQLIGNLVAVVFFSVVGGVFLALGATKSAALITTELLWYIVGTILLAVVFYLIGVRVDRAVRWRHLIYLAVGTTVLTVLVNAVFARTAPTVVSLLGSAFQAFLAMGIGGAFAARAKGRTQPQASVAQPVAVSQAPYGYGYGALAPGSMPLYPGQPAPGSMPMYPPQSIPPYPQPAPNSTPLYPGSVPPYPQPAPGGMPLYPQPNSGWNPNPAAPSVYPSAWPYPPNQADGQTPGNVPPSPPSQQPPATQPPGMGAE